MKEEFFMQTISMSTVKFIKGGNLLSQDQDGFKGGRLKKMATVVSVSKNSAVILLNSVQIRKQKVCGW